MGETVTGGPAPEPLPRRTREPRLGLLRLHKTPLDAERAVYEPAYVQPGPDAVPAHRKVTQVLFADA